MIPRSTQQLFDGHDEAEHVAVRHQITLLLPPKAAFQFLCDPYVWEECTEWSVKFDGEFVGGNFWTERHLARKRRWEILNVDRRALRADVKVGEVHLSMIAKKGGPGSCNLQWLIDGTNKDVAKFVKRYGNRLSQFKAWLEEE